MSASHTKMRSDRVRELVDPVVGRAGYELLEAELVSESGRAVLRLYIDTVPPGTPEKGVNVDDCAYVSRVVGDLLDVEDAVGGQYHLEVSSPGLYRPLTKPAHFERAIGERVRVKTYDKVNDRRVFIGTLKRHDAGQLTVEVDGVDHSVELKDVAKANLEPVLDF